MLGTKSLQDSVENNWRHVMFHTTASYLRCHLSALSYPKAPGQPLGSLKRSLDRVKLRLLDRRQPAHLCHKHRWGHKGNRENNPFGPHIFCPLGLAGCFCGRDLATLESDDGDWSELTRLYSNRCRQSGVSTFEVHTAFTFTCIFVILF